MTEQTDNKGEDIAFRPSIQGLADVFYLGVCDLETREAEILYTELLGDLVKAVSPGNHILVKYQSLKNRITTKARHTEPRGIYEEFLQIVNELNSNSNNYLVDIGELRTRMTKHRDFGFELDSYIPRREEE